MNKNLAQAQEGLAEYLDELPGLFLPSFVPHYQTFLKSEISTSESCGVAIES